MQKNNNLLAHLLIRIKVKQKIRGQLIRDSINSKIKKLYNNSLPITIQLLLNQLLVYQPEINIHHHLSIQILNINFIKIRRKSLEGKYYIRMQSGDPKFKKICLKIMRAIKVHLKNRSLSMRKIIIVL